MDGRRFIAQLSEGRALKFICTSEAGYCKLFQSLAYISKFFNSDLEWAATGGSACYRLLSVSPVAAHAWNSRATSVHNQNVAHGNLTGVCFNYLFYANILTASLGQRSP